MRAVIFVLILAVVAVLIALWSGFLNVSQTREARVPNVATTDNGIAARGGQTPAFDVQTGTVSVEPSNVTLPVPNLEVNPPADNPPPAQQQQAQTNAAQ
jgi:hypothetical protein